MRQGYFNGSYIFPESTNFPTECPNPFNSIIAEIVEQEVLADNESSQPKVDNVRTEIISQIPHDKGTKQNPPRAI